MDVVSCIGSDDGGGDVPDTKEATGQRDLEASRVFEEVARAVSVRRGSDEKQPSGEKALWDPCQVGFECQSLDRAAATMAKLCLLWSVHSHSLIVDILVIGSSCVRSCVGSGTRRLREYVGHRKKARVDTRKHTLLSSERGIGF
ncbi:hypothetical protein L1887_57104 [Cichorium endivia]|nr:hypothetical protein L1887_57104 [Cichorium endivia]